MSRETRDAIEYLEVDPKTTIEYVQYITFLGQVSSRIERIEADIEYAKDVYDLIDEFLVPCPMEEKEDFINFGTIVTNLRDICGKKTSDMELIVNRLNAQINKDIDAIIDEVAAIKEDVNVREFSLEAGLSD